MFRLTPTELAFIERLYDEHQAMLLNYALLKLNDRDIAAEAVQETFRIACNKVQDVMEKDNPTGWLILTLQNTIKKIIESKQQTAIYLTKLPEDFDIENIAADKPPDEDIDLLYSDLAADKDFQLFKLYALKEKSLKTIAVENGLSIDACKQRIYRARKRLLKLLKKHKLF